MPNWCEGTLKVRGTLKNLKNFVLNGLEPVDFIGDAKPPLKVVEETDTYIDIRCSDSSLCMKGTRRHFCKPDYIEMYADEPNEIIVWKTPFKAAWGIDSDSLLQLCKEFNVDMKIQGFERGMQFSQIIEIVDGMILQDDEITYDDWDWNCPCPNMGG